MIFISICKHAKTSYNDVSLHSFLLLSPKAPFVGCLLSLKQNLCYCISYSSQLFNSLIYVFCTRNGQILNLVLHGARLIRRHGVDNIEADYDQQIKAPAKCSRLFILQRSTKIEWCQALLSNCRAEGGQTLWTFTRFLLDFVAASNSCASFCPRSRTTANLQKAR